ncbi:MAG: hypothetical protein ACMXYA_00895 [Candidatus Woesearchaeota archaeon]
MIARKITYIFFVITLVFIIPFVVATIGSTHTVSEVWVTINSQHIQEEMNLMEVFNRNLQSTAGGIDCGENSCLMGFSGSNPFCAPAGQLEWPEPMGLDITYGSGCGKRCRLITVSPGEFHEE